MPSTELNLRRPPKQDRSRERVDEILNAAKQLIGEKGIDAVKMREIATRAGGPISSIYQYFPNKSAIIANLHARWTDELTKQLNRSLTQSEGFDTLFEALSATLDYCCQRITNDPAIMDLLNAIQADKALNNADIAATRAHVKIFTEAARSWVDPTRFEQFDRVAFLMFQLAGATVRLALSTGQEEAESIVADYKMMIRTQLTAFIKK